MSFKAGKTITGKIPNKMVDPYKGLPSFSEDDFSYMFYKLKGMKFKGEELNEATNLIFKLQEIYTFYKNKKLIK